MKNKMDTRTAGLAWGIGGEIIELSKYKAGWHEMFNKHNLDKKYKIRENFETYCYMRYLCMDAEAMFVERLREWEK